MAGAQNIEGVKLREAPAGEIYLPYSTEGYKTEPAPYMRFGDVGELSWEGGVFRFKGDADKSAEIFLDFLQRHMNAIRVGNCNCDTELLSILERAREFVNDNEDDLMRNMGTTLSVYIPLTRQRNADEEAQQAIDKAERLKRETQLRSDIEDMIRRMR